MTQILVSPLPASAIAFTHLAIAFPQPNNLALTDTFVQ